MEFQTGPATAGTLPAGQVLASIRDLLDRVDQDRSGLPAPTRLEWARSARVLADRVTALAQLLIGEADRVQAAERASGTPTSSWLSIDGNLSRRESAGLLHRSRALADHPAVGAAAADGRIGAGQAKAITDVLGSLASQLDDAQRASAERVMVGLASTMDADRLARAAGDVLAAVAPASADEQLEQRLQREAEAAHRNRSLVFFRDGNGSVSFRGSLPRTDAEAWLVQLDAYMESQRRTALEERDPLAVSPTPGQRRADALVAMIRDRERGRQGPSVGGDRPRVVVTLDHEALRRGAAGAGLIADGEQLSAGELRRLCCDADLVPAVLGGASEVLDVGRANRLVTPAIRTALMLRDGGCAFPGCQTRPNACEAHHIVPWRAGGVTALSNLVLLCHHHHALVEPARYGVRDQWLMRLGPDGVPEAVPPARQDPQRKPVRHQRFCARTAGAAAVGGASPATGTDPPQGGSGSSRGSRTRPPRRDGTEQPPQQVAPPTDVAPRPHEGSPPRANETGPRRKGRPRQDPPRPEAGSRAGMGGSRPEGVATAARRVVQRYDRMEPAPRASVAAPRLGCGHDTPQPIRWLAYAP
ncbi:MAG: DUF222 domain-containing protein [Propionicimonas sp.]|uniref:HNH endonuclease signature motif containing protein n=1 Tax=Propionicimonas sp. TaxID=1955623 RepID=UPI003D0A9138